VAGCGAQCQALAQCCSTGSSRAAGAVVARQACHGFAWGRTPDRGTPKGHNESARTVRQQHCCAASPVSEMLKEEENGIDLFLCSRKVLSQFLLGAELAMQCSVGP
jgi:hypothetical protein